MVSSKGSPCGKEESMMETLYQFPEETQEEPEKKESLPGTIYDSVERRFFPALVRRRDNAFYRRGMAIRYAMQFQAEGVDAYEGVENWKAYREMLRRREVRYKLFPQVQEWIVVSCLGGELLPNDFSTRVTIIDGWIADIPEGKKVGGTRGFGGKHKGSRPKSREPERYIRLGRPIKEIVEQLEIDKVEYYRDEIGNIILIGVDREKGREYIEAMR